jgi:CRISPR/Cas system-associated exonuclease Cas4 (RecB family)
VQTAGRFVNSDYGRAARDASRSGKLRRETNFGLAVGRHRLSGKIDLSIQAPEEFLVVDYKTGDIGPKVPEYRNQLMLYALALKHLQAPPVFRLVMFALDNPAETREYVISPGELESFGKRAEATLDGIAEGSNEAIPSPENCSGCTWMQSCSYAYRKQAGNRNNGYHN